ncbi:hypothetical protein ACJMK2_010875 [Sinanodonta woodiana]|uniref:Transmembrane protein 231 n=1 Tax=Sinanodonta woodiana TaxID=1069815 RepID=A0ABD3VIC6_SINWO
MAVYEVFSHPELRRYKTSICSKASLMMLFILALTFIPPLFVVYRSYGFWRKTDYYREYPDIHFKRELLLVLELEGEGNYVTYGTFQKYNQLQNAHLRVPLITSRETDTNRDGKPDSLIFNLEMPLLDSENVLGVKLILIFDYKLHQFSSLTMESIGYANYDAIKPGGKFEILGDLRVNQKEPIGYRGVDNRYNTSVIDSTSVYAESYDFINIFKSYTSRNLTTYLNAPYMVWSTGRGASQPFVISATINYVEEQFLYTPGFWYLIKWGWVQYVSVLLIFLFFFDRVKVFIYQNQLVPTMVEKPWREEKMK